MIMWVILFFAVLFFIGLAREAARKSLLEERRRRIRREYKRRRSLDYLYGRNRDDENR